VTTLGPNAVGASELPPEVLKRADIVVTDSRAQLHAYFPPHIGAGHADVVELGDLVNDPSPVRRSAGRLSVFLSTGLAGTEVAIAVHLAETAAG
jgi:ornithine cyclodeaminase